MKTEKFEKNLNRWICENGTWKILKETMMYPVFEMKWNDTREIGKKQVKLKN